MSNSITKTNKTKTLTFVIIAILAASTLFLTSNVSAHNPPISIPSYVYINAFPTPVGVGQTISLFAWSATYPPTAEGEYGDRWTNCIITVTQPDGSNTTLGPFTSDSVGTVFASFVPTTAGNYTFTFHLPNQKITGVNSQYPVTPPSSLTGTQYINDTFLAADSAPVTVQVTDSPIAPAVSYPIPTDYWTNPISQPGHQNWQFISGDWLAATIPGANINDFTQPPTTAHIAWTKPINFGGSGGQPSAIASGGDNYYSYLSYEGMFTPPIVMGGVLYYNTANPPEYGWTAVDLRTGQQLWYNNGTQDPLMVQQLGFGFAKQNYPQLSYGQELDYESPNQHGLIDYLWVTYALSNGSNVWAMYDPFSGNWICDIVGVPAGSAFFGASSMITDQIGSYLIFSFSADFKTVTVWNSTQCIQNTQPSLAQANGYWMWRPQLGGKFSASSGITTYNTTGIPADFQKTAFGIFGPSNSLGLSLLGIDAQKQIAIYSNATAVLGMAAYPSPNGIAQMGISIAPDSMGQYKWSKISTYPSGNVTLLGGFAGDGVFTLYNKELAQWIAYNSTSGEQIWTSKSEVSNHIYGVTGGVYNNVLYSGDSIGEGGVIYAYDITNGNLLWQTEQVSMGNNGYWNYVPRSVGTFASGIIYWYGSEHSPGPNLEPGFKLGAVNSTTGNPIWNITFWNAGGGFGAGIPIADGYLTALNAYDNQIYAFGKGPTSTTVQTPLTAVSPGQGLIIQGTVMDISSGTMQSTIAPRFPNGVPAVSDADQTAWMEYIYMQNPKPTSVSGVQISIDAIDPNGNTINLGTTHSDSSGLYSFQVNPNMLTAGAGTYTIIATFAGSNAYWPSSSESTILIGNEAAATPTATPTPSSMVEAYFLPAVAAIIIILIVGIALIMLMLRKRP